MVHIKDLPFEFEIVQDEHGFNLMQSGFCLTCRPTLEETFDVLCKLRLWIKSAIKSA